MSHPTSSEASVLQAAQELVNAFARHDRDAYFRAFSEDARFIFHSHPERLANRAQYQALWQDWETTLGFRVLACLSTQPEVQMVGTAAIFTHAVRTTVQSEGVVSTLDERETIVFAQQLDGRWLAVHEHLSPAPLAASNTDSDTDSLAAKESAA